MCRYVGACSVTVPVTSLGDNPPPLRFEQGLLKAISCNVSKFDKLSSEISLCYENNNNMKSYISCTESISPVNKQDFGTRDNVCPILTQLSRLTGKLSVVSAIHT